MVRAGLAENRGSGESSPLTYQQGQTDARWLIGKKFNEYGLGQSPKKSLKERTTMELGIWDSVDSKKSGGKQGETGQRGFDKEVEKDKERGSTSSVCSDKEKTGEDILQKASTAAAAGE